MAITAPSTRQEVVVAWARAARAGRRTEMERYENVLVAAHETSTDTWWCDAVSVMAGLFERSAAEWSPADRLLTTMVGRPARRLVAADSHLRATRRRHKQGTSHQEQFAVDLRRCSAFVVWRRAIVYPTPDTWVTEVVHHAITCADYPIVREIDVAIEARACLIQNAAQDQLGRLTNNRGDQVSMP
jgi:hypothetical protein